jgi:phospholipid transport system substrate-binding protein
MTRAPIVVAAVLALLAARDAGAGVPTDQLRGSIDLVLKIVTDPELKKEARTAERRKRIREVVNQIFDFTEISQRCLGRHWPARTPAEREQFVALFGDLLENAYITKIESYSGEKIQYPGDVIEGELAIVKTRIVTKQETEIPSTTACS